MPISDGNLEASLAAAASGKSGRTHPLWPLQESSPLHGRPNQSHDLVPAPDYLQQYYWWAYVDPRAVRLFERQWLVDLILLGNYRNLAKAVIDELAIGADASVLQVACAYGDYTPNLIRRVREAGGHLDVIESLSIQLDNLSQKLDPNDPIQLWQMDSRQLDFADNTVDYVVLFFLMHEQPDVVRRQTLAEAHRVLRPGGRLIIVDYARPALWNLLRFPLLLILPPLEPFFLDLWTDDLSSWMPSILVTKISARNTFFGGLYQKIIIIK